MRRVATACVVMLALVACGGDIKTPPPTTAATTTPTTALTGFGTQRVATPSPDDAFQAKLVALRVGDHDQFVRAVFEFDSGVPPYVVELASPPFVQDGSGNEVNVAGDHFLTVRLDQTVAHDENGTSTVQSQRIAGPAEGSVTELVRLGDFEGVVNYVIGVRGPKPFRVLKLVSPPRLVVDVAA